MAWEEMDETERAQWLLRCSGEAMGRAVHEFLFDIFATRTALDAQRAAAAGRPPAPAVAA